MPFARAVTDMVEEMKLCRQGCPQLPPQVPSFRETLTQEWHMSDVWQFAGLDDLYSYLRKAKALRIPEDLQSLFPKKL